MFPAAPAISVEVPEEAVVPWVAPREVSVEVLRQAMVGEGEEDTAVVEAEHSAQAPLKGSAAAAADHFLRPLRQTL